MAVRKQQKRVISTYVARRSSGKFAARVVDGRTKKENQCTKAEMREAIACSRDKVLA